MNVLPVHGRLVAGRCMCLGSPRPPQTRNLFREMDVDGTGVLDLAKLGNWIVQHGLWDVTFVELKAMLRRPGRGTHTHTPRDRPGEALWPPPFQQPQNPTGCSASWGGPGWHLSSELPSLSPVAPWHMASKRTIPKKNGIGEKSVGPSST